jgi:hypothetical protein
LEYDSFADRVRYALSFSNATQVLSLIADFVRFVSRRRAKRSEVVAAGEPLRFRDLGETGLESDDSVEGGRRIETRPGFHRTLRASRRASRPRIRALTISTAQRM